MFVLIAAPNSRNIALLDQFRNEGAWSAVELFQYSHCLDLTTYSFVKTHNRPQAASQSTAATQTATKKPLDTNGEILL